MGRGPGAVSIANGLPQKAKEVPTLAEFAPKCLDGYARANPQKASGIAARETILRVHLVPSLWGEEIGCDYERGRSERKEVPARKSAKTVNNVLTVLNKMLKTAIEWDE